MEQHALSSQFPELLKNLVGNLSGFPDSGLDEFIFEVSYNYKLLVIQTAEPL